MIKAIFFDLDGTLLSHTTRCIPQDTVQALRKLRDKGIRIFMATGRHSTELSRLPVHDIRFDGYVTLNGQLCLNNSGDVIFGTPFNESAARNLTAFFREKRYPLALVEADRIYINYVDDTVRKNGGDCVRKIADYVTSGVDDDGTGKALRYFHII